MANKEHLFLLRQGVDTWNGWRSANFGLEPDLRGADLKGADLRGADLSWVGLSRADLRGANLNKTNLSWVDLSRADLRGASLNEAKLDRADLRRANLTRADLKESDIRQADLRWANLSRANLSRANLSKANLSFSLFSKTNLKNANLAECLIYGMSICDLKLQGANQSNLHITPANKLTITVKNLEVAVFISLLLNSHTIGDVINTIKAKIVLIIGYFPLERKAVLDSIQEALCNLNYLPVVFNFDKPASRDITEAISCVANMAQFAIADITNGESILQELHKLVPYLPLVIV